MDFTVSTESVPTNRSSKYDDVVSALKGLADGQHLEIKCADADEAENTSNAIRSAAKAHGLKLSVTKRAEMLYVKVNKN